MSFKYYIRGVEGTLTLPKDRIRILCPKNTKRHITEHSYNSIARLISWKETNICNNWVTMVHWSSCDRAFISTFNYEPWKPASRWGDYNWNELHPDVQEFLEAVIEDRFTIVDD